MILVLCGPPGVGKTTVATLLQERLRERGWPVQVLDSDEFSTSTYDRLFDRIEGSEEDWIVAATFYKRRWQRRFRRLDDVRFVYLTADLETCLERNRRRETPIDEAAVHIIWREFDEPDADLVIDVRDQSPDEVVDRVLSFVESGPEDGRPTAPD